MCKYQIVKIMMDWKRLISAKRFGMEEFHEERQENRSEFQPCLLRPFQKASEQNPSFSPSGQYFCSQPTDT